MKGQLTVILISIPQMVNGASLVAQLVKNLPEMQEAACSGGDMGSITGSRGSPGEENGKPLQYSCLGNPIEKPGGLLSMGSPRGGLRG